MARWHGDAAFLAKLRNHPIPTCLVSKSQIPRWMSNNKTGRDGEVPLRSGTPFPFLEHADTHIN